MGSYMLKNEIRIFSNTIHKNKLKMYYKHKCKIRYYTTLRGKHRKTIQSYINCSNIFFELSPRVREIKTKRKKWDLIKLKSFLHSKGNHRQNENTTHRIRENICKWCTDKGVVSKIYKELIRLIIKKQTTQSKNVQKT